MATMNLSLPDKMKEWVAARAATGRYSNAADYVRDLIRKDQDRTDKVAHIQHLVDEGLESGISQQSLAEIERAARREAEGR